MIKAVDGIDFVIQSGETLGIVGESGCGKSTTSRLVLRLEIPTGGSVLFRDQDIQRLAGDELRVFRNAVQVVFQDPTSALNPRMRVGEIIGEPLLVSARHTKDERQKRVENVIEEVGLRSTDLDKYPHEFSGGQRQRIAIARALSTRPDLIILDEPVSSLDVSVRAQILNLLKRFQREYGLAFLMIAHDLTAVRFLSNRIGVMYLGKMMEIGPCQDLYSSPLHPYTRALLSATLPHHPDAPQPPCLLTGEVPSPLNPPSGCRFHPRCDRSSPRCFSEEPTPVEIRPGHWVNCHFS